MLLIALAMLSCVARKKYEAASSEASEVRAMMKEQTAAHETQMSEVTAKNRELENELKAYKSSCETTQRKLDQVQGVLAEEEETLERVQEKLEIAMEDFSSRGVEVYVKQGLLYVSLPDEILYKSGSSTLGKEGKKALSPLASVLNDYPRLKVIVVGHTDNVDYKRGGDNWTLSTERANGVVRQLSQQYKVDPARLTAAGKAKYNPVADNGTVAGRSKNRRTDIILNPDYERIWEMARQEQ